MPKFNVGDKVRVLNNDSGYSEDFTGQESEVIEADQDWCEIKVQYKDGGYSYLTFKEDNLEKVVDDSNDAASILQQAKDCLVNRGVERDKPNGERSMKSTVEAFNALTGHSLTEEQGWIFMVALKMARSQGGCYKADDYIDMAAYAALAGEAGANNG